MSADPRRQWKGSVWRYYHESMLSCCADLEEVKKQGVTFATFLCLARCQGLVAEGRYADACGGPDGFEASFREALEATCRGDGESEEAYVCVSYSRGALGQTGSGHFSPLGCYDPEADAVLVLDTARFKYPPHWVPVPALCEAMAAVDEEAGRSRGFAVLKMRGEPGVVVGRLLKARVGGRGWRERVGSVMGAGGGLEVKVGRAKEVGVMELAEPVDNPVDPVVRGELEALAKEVEEEGAYGVAVEELGADEKCCDAPQTKLGAVTSKHVLALFILAVGGGAREGRSSGLEAEIEAFRRILHSVTPS